MTTVYDVPADLLIERTAEKLKQREEIVPPEWATFVKTGVHKEKPPVERDWWYTRTAAVLRKIYLKGPIGTERLRAMFGGAQDRRVKPYRARKGSGAIIRHSLQQLEKAGLVLNVKGRGRMITPQGRSFLDNTAHEVLKELVKENKPLEKY